MNIKLIFRLILVVAAAAPISGLFAQAEYNKLKLETAIQVALANNIPVKQRELQLGIAEKNFQQSRMNRLPVISADMNYGINNGRSIDPFTNNYINQQLSSSNGSLTTIIPVFRGFQVNNSIRQNHLNSDAVKMELQQEKDNLVLNIILSFMQVLNNEDVLALYKQQAGVTETQVRRLEILEKEGSISPSVLTDVKGQLATEQLAIVNATNILASSRLSLTQFMNVPYGSLLSLDRDGLNTEVEPYTRSPNELYDSARKKLALVKAANLRSKAALQGVKVARSFLYPTLSLFGQLNTNYSSAARSFNISSVTDIPSGDYVLVGGSQVPVMTSKTVFNENKISYLSQINKNVNTYFGVSLQVPLFSAFQTRTRITVARIESRNAALAAENTQVQLRQAIEKAHLDMVAAKDKYEISLLQVEAFKESFRAAELRFGLGAINSVEYLIVKANLDRASLNLTVSKYEHLLRIKVLKFYEGDLEAR